MRNAFLVNCPYLTYGSDDIESFEAHVKTHEHAPLKPAPAPAPLRASPTQLQNVNQYIDVPAARTPRYDTDITSWPGRACAALGQLWLVSWPTLRGLLASRGFVPTGCRGAGGTLGGSEAGDANEDRALSPPGLEAELRGVSASLEASESSSSFTSSPSEVEARCAAPAPPDAAANASM
ncbi:hypothetical protein EVAR_14393_1 [Eumeta japonica]|uniref:Uncharacterized protein n=1 Tax=Eumeta variegata TaxID=151549 RepID=A0A4C1TX37_EUMVA|nr:hypothetical protein EVAR_14393_1 [Eumeta japonica]